MKHVRQGLERIVGALSNGRSRLALVTVGTVAGLTLLAGCAGTPNYSAELARATNVQPYANGNTIQGTVVSKVRTSAMGYLADSPGVLEALDLSVQTPDGRCYRFGPVVNPGSSNSEETSQLDMLAAQIELGKTVKVSGLDPKYKGEKTCKDAYSSRAVAPSQIEVVR